MSFNLSTGMQKNLLSENEGFATYYTAATISFGDGDGTGSTDTINDSSSGLAAFAVHDWILIISGGANANKLVKAQTVAAGKIEVVAGSFTAVTAATVTLVKLKSIGTVQRVLQNGIMVGFTGSRPSDADQSETGTQLIKITKDAGAFTAGASLNGLNVEGDAAGTTVNRATDPETGATEVWQGAGLAAGTVGYVRWYDNAYTTGASTTASRMDGTVATSGADVNMANGTKVAIDAISNVTSIAFTMTGV